MKQKIACLVAWLEAPKNPTIIHEFKNQKTKKTWTKSVYISSLNV